MDKFRIDDQFENNSKKDKQLTNAERKAFENELDEINRLIEQNLDDDSEITETKTITVDPVKEPTSPTTTIADQSNELGMLNGTANNCNDKKYLKIVTETVKTEKH